MILLLRRKTARKRQAAFRARRAVPERCRRQRANTAKPCSKRRQNRYEPLPLVPRFPDCGKSNGFGETLFQSYIGRSVVDNQDPRQAVGLTPKTIERCSTTSERSSCAWGENAIGAVLIACGAMFTVNPSQMRASTKESALRGCRAATRNSPQVASGGVIAAVGLVRRPWTIRSNG